MPSATHQWRAGGQPVMTRFTWFKQTWQYLRARGWAPASIRRFVSKRMRSWHGADEHASKEGSGMKMNEILVRAIKAAETDASIGKLVHAVMAGERGPDTQRPAGKEWKRTYTTPVRCWIWGTDPQGLGAYGLSAGVSAPGTAYGWDSLLQAIKVSECSVPAHRTSHKHYLQHVRRAVEAIIKLRSMELPSVEQVSDDDDDGTYPMGSDGIRSITIDIDNNKVIVR